MAVSGRLIVNRLSQRLTETAPVYGVPADPSDPTRYVRVDEVERHRQERADHGFAAQDWWAFDTYVAWVTLGGLRKFRAEGHGFPAQFDTVDQWNAILDEMIVGFDYYVTSDDIDKYSDPRWKRAWELLTEFFGHLWD